MFSGCGGKAYAAEQKIREFKKSEVNDYIKQLLLNVLIQEN